MNPALTKPPFPLREAHCHLAAHGRALSMLRLDGCTSAEECIERLREDAARTSAAWVLAIGARVESWREPRWPTRTELDRVGRPCCVMSFDHHAVAANTEAFEASGLLHGASPPGGVICRDASGDPSGVVLEAAAHQVWNAAPGPTDVEQREFVRTGAKDLFQHGFTEVHDLLSPLWLGPILGALDRAGELPLSVHMYVPVEDVEAQHRGAVAWQSPRVRLAGAKVFADGTLNSRTAWMLSPYSDPLPGLERGKVITPPPNIRQARERSLALGLGLAVHAIGDAAVRAVLEAERDIQRARGRPAVPLRIEHCELIDRTDVSRFAELGAVASVQPCHLLVDFEVLTRQLPHRLDRVLPLRELVDAGLVPGRTLIFGSDTPIVRPHPQDSIHAAVHRRRAGMKVEEAIAPAQAISEREAWAAFSATEPR